MLAKLSESVFVSVGVTRGSDGIPAADFDNGSGTGGGDVVVPSATLSSTNSVWSNSGGGSAGDDGRDGNGTKEFLLRSPDRRLRSGTGSSADLGVQFDSQGSTLWSGPAAGVTPGTAFMGDTANDTQFSYRERGKYEETMARAGEFNSFVRKKPEPLINFFLATLE